MELEKVLARLAEGARKVSQADAAALRLLNNQSTLLSEAASSGLSAEIEEESPIPLKCAPLDKDALVNRQPTIIDVKKDPRAKGLPGEYRSALCLPLIHEDEPIGTLQVYSNATEHFDESDINLLLPIVDLGTAAITAIRALKSLENVDSSRARFIRVATHELRSPVAVAQSLVRGVLKGYTGELNDKQEDTLGRISRRLDFLESLINDLLDLAAGKAPELTEEEQQVAINASVGRAVLLLQPRAEEKGVELVHRTCCEELVVWGTEEGLDRIFVNLIGNAVKYTPSGGNVTVSLGRVEDEIQVKVADTGIGIPEEARPQLFEEFYRAPNAKAMDAIGTGLGLAIVKDLVDRYGGHIELESSLGEGSTFTVTFPVVANW